MAGWQRRWFEVRQQELFWFASEKAAESGNEPLGRVPLAMILAARPTGSSGGFEVRARSIAQRAQHRSTRSAPPSTTQHRSAAWRSMLTWQVDLGNRQLQLCLDGVPKALHEVGVRKWVEALVAKATGKEKGRLV